MFILHIPEPCQENWDEMTPEVKGRFCGSCQKKVMDFTTMSDEQVKNYLLDNNHKNTCGRFKTSQLGRPLENQNLIINENWYRLLPFSKQVFYAVAVYFILGVSSCDFSGTKEKNAASDMLLVKTVQTAGILPPEIDTSGLNKIDTFPAPKANIINHPGPTPSGDVAIGIPDHEVMQGAPIWQEERPVIDTTREMKGKIAAPTRPEIDTVKPPDSMIMGGIGVPIQNQKIEDNKKPR